MKPIIVVIVGPTASGKTALSIELAKKINGEIISADSMQIYKDMDIGTAKVTKEEACGIKHYLVDFLSPDKRYTVSDFKKDCEQAIQEILRKEKIPIVVGGTGLYINSLIYGVEYQEMNFDEKYRKELMKKAETSQGLEEIWENVCKIDPISMKKISKNDKKRIVRVLEIYKATGKTKTELEVLSRQKDVKYKFKVFGINLEREKLYEKINYRVDLMFENGLEKEVKNLISKYSKFPTAMQGLGYKEVVQYFYGLLTYDEMIEKIKQETRRYAKRQLTWFRRNKEIIWLDGQNSLQDNVNNIIKELYEGEGNKRKT